ncbi:MAG TPA: hydrogenase 3 maturation endopeptidase HyCI [Candidatus Methylomirabilis sp.]
MRPSWRSIARQTLQSLPRAAQDPSAVPPRPPRVAVVGVGNEFNGDDAAGVRVARALQRRQRAGASDAPRPASVFLLVLEGGLAPENLTGAIRRFAPDLVLLVDAAEMGEPTGAVRWLSWQDTTGVSAATHALPPYMVAQFLVSELACEVALVGIQPQGTTFGASLSPPVRRAVRTVTRGLTALLVTEAAFEPPEPR